MSAPLDQSSGEAADPAVDGYDEAEHRTPEDDPSFSPEQLLERLRAHNPIAAAAEAAREAQNDNEQTMHVLRPLPVVDGFAAGKEEFVGNEVFANEMAREEATTDDLVGYVIRKQTSIIERARRREEEAAISDTSSIGIGQDEVDGFSSDGEDDGVEYELENEFN